jgi:hypothetical protein
MKRYPLLFSYRETVAGKGYIAQVHLEGRALFEIEEGGEVWLYGVHPGALADTGPTPPKAYVSFRTRLTSVLYDIAAEAPDFSTFRAEVLRFFEQCDEQTKAEWEEARTAVRASDDDLAGLSKVPAPPDPIAEVEELTPQLATPALNVLRADEDMAVAA